jgi:hypothetical protein
MSLGQLLIDKTLIEPSELDAALQHQKRSGGSLVESLLMLGFVSAEELDAFLDTAPVAPDTIGETGLDGRFLLDFILKAAYVTGRETVVALGEFTKLPAHVVDAVLEDAKSKRMVEVLGLAGHLHRYALTDEGRRWALNALDQCQYTGPAPVPLGLWQEQVVKQSITRDHLTPDRVREALSHLVLPDDMVSRLGPAGNSGRAVLFYGGVGNGKTSIAEALGHAFAQEISIPYCVELDGQIIKVFDSALHQPVGSQPDDDARWERCKRPVVITGGELTLEMLDLSFDEISKTYEAPAHLKATGGVFIIDDFGRQRARPQDLLNRWIFPLEHRVDFLTLHTGKKVRMLFDQLVIFSTNFAPQDLMDEAGLRRIPYKFDIGAPDPEIYTLIMKQLCEARRLELPDRVLDYLLNHFYPHTKAPLSAAHPAFIVEHVIERCRFDGREPEMDLEIVREAAQHLVVDGEAPPVDRREVV